jgi:thiamine pyrophosphate-dependent acetolactate synthase large subunit-like protein
MADDPKRLSLVLREAFRLAVDGRAGVVHIDIPKDVLAAPASWRWQDDGEFTRRARLSGQTDWAAHADSGGVPSGRSSDVETLIAELSAHISSRDIVTVGCGVPKSGMALPSRVRDRPAWLTCAVLTTPGYALPAAIGAKAAQPDARVWAVDNSDGFQVSGRELITARTEGIPVKLLIARRRHWLPDVAQWAAAMGSEVVTAESRHELSPAIAAAKTIDDRPVVIDIRSDRW